MFLKCAFSLGNLIFAGFHLLEHIQVLAFGFEAVELFDPVLYTRKLLYKSFSFLGVVPETGRCCDFFLFLNLPDFAVIVKETSLTQPGVP